MREKMIELIAPVLQCLPWGQVSSHTAGDIADRLIANGVVISNLETATKWIPVTERLPRYNEEVLVYRPKMAMKIYVSSYEGYYGEDDDEWHEGWGICGDITHWMPLPEPPKGE